MEDLETQHKAQDLMQQIQDKSVQLADLEVILEDYAHERQELLREIGRLKAALWELVGSRNMPPPLRRPGATALDEVND